MFFYGKEKRTMDKKGRISVSKKIRDELGREPIILKRSGRIRIYPQKEIEKFKPSQVFPVKIDKQGRILIPAKLLFRFLSGNRIIMVGCGEYLEIRPRKKIPFSEITLRRISVLYDGDKKEVKKKC